MFGFDARARNIIDATNGPKSQKSVSAKRLRCCIVRYQTVNVTMNGAGSSAKEAKVVVGARSAIFAPLDDLGLIIIDEEHEASYKQEDMPRYQARDVALWRGKYHNCPVVLGSATPDLATRARAKKGVYQQLNLTKRINGSSLPQVTLVDMREAVKTAPAPDFFADTT